MDAMCVRHHCNHESLWWTDSLFNPLQQILVCCVCVCVYLRVCVDTFCLYYSPLVFVVYFFTVIGCREQKKEYHVKNAHDIRRAFSPCDSQLVHLVYIHNIVFVWVFLLVWLGLVSLHMLSWTALKHQIYDITVMFLWAIGYSCQPIPLA